MLSPDEGSTSPRSLNSCTARLTSRGSTCGTSRARASSSTCSPRSRSRRILNCSASCTPPPTGPLCPFRGKRINRLTAGRAGLCLVRTRCSTELQWPGSDGFSWATPCLSAGPPALGRSPVMFRTFGWELVSPWRIVMARSHRDDPAARENRARTLVTAAARSRSDTAARRAGRGIRIVAAAARAMSTSSVMGSVSRRECWCRAVNGGTVG